MIQPGAKSLTKIAVIGRGTAGSLAAASVTRLHPDSELHHIYDSRIPVIGVGEGSWPSLVQELHKLTELPHETVQQRLNGTRKYGVAFQGGWGRRDRDFTHYFTPQQVSYAYHLSADLMGELLEESTRARHIDANVRKITRVEGGAEVEFEGRAPERYDLVFDARGFPKELRPEEHIDISFIPTNTAVIRRCPAVIKEEKGPVLQHTYTRAVARPHGWVFVIPLTAHTSYGYIFNRDVTDLAEVESDFDDFLEADGVSSFEQRAVIPFPNYVHRRIFDGAVARIGNAAAFMEPLEATAIVSAQVQIGMVLHIRLHRPIEHLERDAPVVNRFLINNMLCYGLFVGWHYSCGSNYDSKFWRHARDRAWAQHRRAADPDVVDCSALHKFDDMIELLNRSVIDKSDWNRTCAVPLTSYAQVSRVLAASPDYSPVAAMMRALAGAFEDFGSVRTRSRSGAGLCSRSDTALADGMDPGTVRRRCQCF